MNRQVTNSMCAHQWAHQLQQSGNGSNFYFEGRVIYSYGQHFPIAYHAGNFILFTRHSYSRTTSKHKFLTRSAISHKQVLLVDHVPTSQREFESLEWKDKNVKSWLDRIKNLQEEFSKFRRRFSIQRKIGEEFSYLVSFCDNFGIALNGLLKKRVEGYLIEGLSEIYNNWNAFRAAEQLKAMRRQETEIKNQLEDWRHHQTNRFAGDVIGNLAFLRFARKGGEIETSKGIFVPIPVAKRFWLFVQRQLQSGDNLGVCKFMQYKVDEVSESRIIVGCHTISMSEVEYIAKSLNWQ